MRERVVERGWVCWAGLGDVWLGWERGQLKSQPMLRSGGLPVVWAEARGNQSWQASCNAPAPLPCVPLAVAMRRVAVHWHARHAAFLNPIAFPSPSCPSHGLAYGAALRRRRRRCGCVLCGGGPHGGQCQRVHGSWRYVRNAAGRFLPAVRCALRCPPGSAARPFYSGHLTACTPPLPPHDGMPVPLLRWPHLLAAAFANIPQSEHMNFQSPTPSRHGRVPWPAHPAGPAPGAAAA